jgi:hypothetical protein
MEMARRPPPRTAIPSTRALLGVGGLAVFVLAFWGIQAGAALLAGLSEATPVTLRTSAPTAEPTPTASLPAATATAKPTDADWHTYSYPTYGFSVAIPTVLSPQHSLLINNGTGEKTDWVYQGAALHSPLATTAAETIVVVQYSTVIVEANLCPSGGKPITVGPGIPAEEMANVPPDSNGPAASQPYVRVNVVTQGVAIQIELIGQGDPATFVSRYGPLWQYMLASFATFAPFQPLGTHPCG